MGIVYEALSHPLPKSFREWYPYDKPETYPDNSDHPWLRGMQRVTADALPGLKHTFLVARDDAVGRYVGVCWLCESTATPELAHFGWFLVEEAYRGRGIGAQILDRAIARLQSHGVEMIMLPTLLSTKLARGMYARRGFRDTIIEKSTGRCWMVRAKPGHHERYFSRAGDIECGAFVPADYIAFDYLLCRPKSESRLYSLGVVGTKRIVSFKQTWEGQTMVAARVGGRLVGIAAANEAENDIVEFDAFALRREVLDALFSYALQTFERPVRCHVARSDTQKRATVEAAGFRLIGHDEAKGPDDEVVAMDVFLHEPVN